MTDDRLDLTPSEEGLLERYFAGTATSDEGLAARAVLARDLRLDAFFRQLRTPMPYRQRPAVEETFAELRVRLGMGGDAETVGGDIAGEGRGFVAANWGKERRLGMQMLSRTIGVRRTPKLFGVTALFFAFCSMCFLHVYKPRTSNAVHRFRTIAGQRMVVHLPGGSTMILAPVTEATVRPGRVEITGEAHFSIAPRSDQPFIVQTQNAIVRVLGTAFDVRQYARESKSRIAVEDGRVTVQRRGMTPNAGTVLSSRMLVLVTDSVMAVTSGIDIRLYAGWTRGTLVFNGTPLRDVIAELRVVYGAEIHLADTGLSEKPIVADIVVQQKTLAQILDAISIVVHAQCIRKGNTYTLSHRANAEDERRNQVRKNRVPQPEKMYGR